MNKQNQKVKTRFFTNLQRFFQCYCHAIFCGRREASVLDPRPSCDRINVTNVAKPRGGTRTWRDTDKCAQHTWDGQHCVLLNVLNCKTLKDKNIDLVSHIFGGQLKVDARSMGPNIGLVDRFHLSITTH